MVFKTIFLLGIYIYACTCYVPIPFLLNLFLFIVSFLIGSIHGPTLAIFFSHSPLDYNSMTPLRIEHWARESTWNELSLPNFFTANWDSNLFLMDWAEKPCRARAMCAKVEEGYSEMGRMDERLGEKPG